jgi:hypothetical protein
MSTDAAAAAAAADVKTSSQRRRASNADKTGSAGRFVIPWATTIQQ